MVAFARAARPAPPLGRMGLILYTLLTGCTQTVSSIRSAPDVEGAPPPSIASCRPTPPVWISGEHGAVGMSSSLVHDCVLTRGGEVFCRGPNWEGTLGVGDTTDYGMSFTSAVRSLRAVEVSGDTSAVCARTRDEEVWCWGRFMVTADDGWLPVSRCGPDGLSEPCALAPVRMAGLSGVLRVTLSGQMGCALVRGGAVYCWGNVVFPTLRQELRGAPPTRLPDVDDAIDLVRVPGSIAVVHEDGRVESTDPIANIRLPVGAVMRSRPESQRYCYLTQTGDVVCWGRNDHGLLGDGTEAPEQIIPPTPVALRCVRGLAVGPFHSCAITSDRHVVCWGANSQGECGVPPSQGARCRSLASGVPEFPCSLTPVRVQDLDGVVAIELAPFRSCAIREDGSTWCWGAVGARRSAVPLMVRGG